MAVIFVGSSQAQMVTGVGTGTDAGAALTDYTKASLETIGTPATPTVINIPGEHPVLWVAFNMFNNDTSWTGDPAVEIFDEQDQVILKALGSSAEALAFQGWNGSSFDSIATTGFLVHITVRIDIKIDLSASGGYEIFANGSSIGSVSGDLSGLTDALDKVKFYGVSSGSFVTRWGEIIIADEDTRGMIVQEAVATADGIHFTDFSGDYTAINNPAVNTGGAVQGTTDGDTQSYVLEDLDTDFATGFDILAVVVNSRSSKGSGSELDLLAHIITDGTNTLEGGDITLDTVPQPRISVFTTAPDGGAWTVAKFNAMEFGLRAKSSA